MRIAFMGKTMENRYTIRTATRGDVTDMVRMRSALENHMQVRNPYLWKHSAKRESAQAELYRKMLENNKILILVIQDAHTKSNIGMGFGMISEHDQYIPGQSGSIEDIWIDPDHRQQGLCRQLVSRLVDFFDSKGIQSLVLRYAQGNHEAEQVWKALGFHPVLSTANAELSEVKERCGKVS